MSASTGPVLVMGAITLGNAVVIHRVSAPRAGRIVVGTGIAALGLAGFERLAPRAAVGLAWLGLVAVLFVRVDPQVPAPVEAFNSWING